MKDVDSSEYLLEPLREGVDFTLYRGRARQADTSILALTVVDECLSPQNLQRLEHEYSLVADLDTGCAARPLTLTRYQGQAMLILKNPGGEPLDLILQQHWKQDLTRFLGVAIGLAVALGHVHR